MLLDLKMILARWILYMKSLRGVKTVAGSPGKNCRHEREEVDRPQGIEVEKTANDRDVISG